MSYGGKIPTGWSATTAQPHPLYHRHFCSCIPHEAMLHQDKAAPHSMQEHLCVQPSYKTILGHYQETPTASNFLPSSVSDTLAISLCPHCNAGIRSIFDWAGSVFFLTSFPSTEKTSVEEVPQVPHWYSSSRKSITILSASW